MVRVSLAVGRSGQRHHIHRLEGCGSIRALTLDVVASAGDMLPGHGRTGEVHIVAAVGDPSFPDAVGLVLDLGDAVRLRDNLSAFLASRGIGRGEEGSA